MNESYYNPAMTNVNHESQNQIKELNNFYQEIIVDHFKHPRFKGRLNDCRFCQDGKNPVCGDIISIFCKLNQQTGQNGIKKFPCLQVYFDGSGCAISQASASIMCEMVQNQGLEETKQAIRYAEQVYTGQTKIDPENIDSDIDALNGISQFPARVKCAALPWKTLECLIAENFDEEGNPISRSCINHLAAIKQQKKLRIVSTEDTK